MTTKIEINPVTRIEGHAKITVALDDYGGVADTRFAVHSFRGFERFLVGAPVERLPALTARVCGICYSAHHLASVRAIENAWDVEVSETTRKLRELLLLGQFIESHTLSLAVLSLPDLLFPREKQRNRNVQYLLQKHRRLVEGAVNLRQAGSRFAEIVGRRSVHPINAIIGGMAAPITEEERNTLADALKKNGKALLDLKDVFLKLLEEGDDEIFNLGNITSNYLALTDGGHLSFYRGRLKLCDAGGAAIIEFEPGEYFDYIKEDETDFSYMKFPETKDGASFRVGPLARVNVAEEIPTPEAAALKDEIGLRYADYVGRPWNGTIPYHYARLVETVYAWERANELLADPAITNEDVKPSGIETKAASGIGVLEAPRGTLVHYYELSEEGVCEKANLVVATQHNNAGINDSLRETAVRVISGSKAEEADLNKLEMVVRAYDPCLSCATHNLPGPQFIIEFTDKEGNVLRRWP